MTLLSDARVDLQDFHSVHAAMANFAGHELADLPIANLEISFHIFSRDWRGARRHCDGNRIHWLKLKSQIFEVLKKRKICWDNCIELCLTLKALLYLIFIGTKVCNLDNANCYTKYIETEARVVFKNKICWNY